MSAMVSVIIPIYNTSKYLKSCLDSVINQTYSNLEIILVDDGSTDASPNIIKHYSKKDSRIKAIRQQNAGQSAARNAGLKLATGDFISFIDSDDRVDPNFIESLIDGFDTNTVLTVCGVHYRRLKQGTSTDVYVSPIRAERETETLHAYILYLLAIDGRMYSTVNKLYRAKIAKTCHFDTTINFAEDTKFVLDYLQKAPGKIKFILKPLYRYNFGTDTSTIRNTATSWENWQKSYRNLQAWLGKKTTIQERFWLGAVNARWRISYLRSKRRAKKLVKY